MIGSDSSNILIKHGATYVRVHACRVMLEKRDEMVGQEVLPQRKMSPRSDCLEKSRRKGQENVNDSSSDDTAEEFEDALYDTGSRSEEEREEVQEDQETENTNVVKETQELMNDSEKLHKEKPKLKAGLIIDYKTKKEDWMVGQVISRAGKVGGKYKDYWNVLNLLTGETAPREMKEGITKWAVHEDETKLDDENEDITNNDSEIEEKSVDDILLNEVGSHEILLISKDLKNEQVERIKCAKSAEIEKWKEEEVYEEVPDEGQERMSTTWVITDKMKNKEVITKARLVARGYEEEKHNIRSDSPTCMKNSVRMLLAIASGKGWKIRSLDVKAAFLQGKSIERNLYLVPPTEFRTKGKLWKLKKVVYGLCDASRSWYLKVVEVLTELGMTVGTLDKALFTFKKDGLEGMVIVHVDDMLYVGTVRFLEQVMEPFARIENIAGRRLHQT